MPTYEYRCPHGHEFEKFFRTISGAPTSVSCPTCGAIAERLMSGGAGLLFKGSGFYLTDYGKNAHATKGPKPAASGTGETGSSSSSAKGSAESSSTSSTGASGSGQTSSGSAGGSGGSAGGAASPGAAGGGPSSASSSSKSSGKPGKKD